MDEAEGKSLLGAVMPRARWLIMKPVARPGGIVAATAAAGRRGPAPGHLSSAARRRSLAG